MFQVGALSCAFVRAHARDRDECMISLCTFGKLVFAGKNNGRKAAKMFKSFLDHTCLKAIMSRFNHFNAKGGAFVRMNDDVVHFERACLVGIFADLPAATKLTLTGSACNTCFMPMSSMADPNASYPIRTWDTMNAARNSFIARLRAGEGVTKISAEAKKMGVNYGVKSAFSIPRSGINPIGPDPNRDNPWSNCPPVFLHGMDAGTLMKVGETTLLYCIRKGENLGIAATTVCRKIDAYCAKVYVENPRNSNVEIGRMALLPQPHGISHYLFTSKSLDGNQRSSIARLMHMYVATCDMFSEYEKRQHCQMYDLVWECREMMLWPLHRCRITEVQAQLNNMDRNLVSYMTPFAGTGPKGGCRSEKHHQWAHYCYHRESMGCSAREYAFERSYAVGHKKQVQFTNKSKTKAIQTSAKHWFRNGVHRLAVHAKIIAQADETQPQIRTDALLNPGPAEAFVWNSGHRMKELMRNKASSMNPPLRLIR